MIVCLLFASACSAASPVATTPAAAALLYELGAAPLRQLCELPCACAALLSAASAHLDHLLWHQPWGHVLLPSSDASCLLALLREPWWRWGWPELGVLVVRCGLWVLQLAQEICDALWLSPWLALELLVLVVLLMAPAQLRAAAARNLKPTLPSDKAPACGGAAAAALLLSLVCLCVDIGLAGRHGGIVLAAAALACAAGWLPPFVLCDPSSSTSTRTPVTPVSRAAPQSSQPAGLPADGFPAEDHAATWCMLFFAACWPAVTGWLVAWPVPTCCLLACLAGLRGCAVLATALAALAYCGPGALPSLSAWLLVSLPSLAAWLAGVLPPLACGLGVVAHAAVVWVFLSAVALARWLPQQYIGLWLAALLFAKVLPAAGQRCVRLAERLVGARLVAPVFWAAPPPWWDDWAATRWLIFRATEMSLVLFRAPAELWAAVAALSEPAPAQPAQNVAATQVGVVSVVPLDHASSQSPLQRSL